MPAIWPFVIEAVDEMGDMLVPWMRRIASFLESPKNGHFA